MENSATKGKQKIDKVDEQLVRGILQRITYHNPDNGYSVLQIQIPQQIEYVTVVGSCISPTVGTQLVVRGISTKHPKYGKQIKANSIVSVAPSSSDGIEKYLASGLIKGIGEKTAKKIVDAFGEDTLDILHRHPEKVASISGVGRHKAKVIQLALEEQKEVQEVMRFLVEHNISTGLASRIYERYDNKSVEILQKDPYVLARQMHGVGFSTADSIALNLGLTHDSEERLKAGVFYALEKARDEGHCFLPIDLLFKRALTLLGLDETYDLSHAVESLTVEGYLFFDDEHNAVYLKRLFDAEVLVAKFIAERVGRESSLKLNISLVDQCLAEAGKALGINFSAQQRDAVHAAAKCPLLLITGGPGCGKTTVIRALVATFQKAGKNLALAAPTGKAAQRMAQVCGIEAKTIHRLLRYDPIKHGFLYGPGHALEVDGEPVDVLIVDEASMIDIALAKDLLSALPSPATIILVGDRDQLPSVGPGRMFADLISQKDVETIALSQLFRRSEESRINSVAHMINAGLTPEIPEPDGKTKSDVYFVARPDAELASSTVEKLVSDQIPRKFGIPSTDIVVLSPSNRGPLGVIALNQKLQRVLNPEAARDSSIKVSIHEQNFYQGDRVCQRVNNYHLDDFGVFNGDTGYIYNIDTKNKKLTVELWDGRLIKYDSGNVSQLSLAYASTVHRSQGTEAPCVVLVLHESHFTLLERQLIYTGVTRAKQLLIVVGSKRALHIASKRATGHHRCTLLDERISSILRT